MIALTKPRITMMVVITAAGSMWLAPGAVGILSGTVALVCLALVVACANTLNCWMEREVDKRMLRTMDRPLPAARLMPGTALWVSAVCGILSIPPLFVFVNTVTAILGALSLVIYVMVYTPMKQLSPQAVLVGAIPGAIPALMGWTAVTGRIDAGGLVLFGILFAWQLPHVIAISTFREAEYTNAGLQVMPAIHGRNWSYWVAVGWTVVLVSCSLLLQPLGVTTMGYTVMAVVLGAVYLHSVVRDLRPTEGEARARRSFKISLIYLTALFFSLMLFKA